jgi:hypothetical protein
VGLQFFSSLILAQNYDNRFHTSASQMFDARFDYALVAKGKQRFECAHAFGLSGGQDEGRNLAGLWSLVLELWHLR